MEDLLNKINNCKEEELVLIVRTALEEKINNSKKEDVLGFTDLNQCISVHKGLIHPETRIKYSSYTMNSYTMKTDDYYYEFAKYIKKLGIKNKGALVKFIENFTINYFGLAGKSDNRDATFDDIAWKTTQTDDEYFEKLEQLSIGDLKGKNVAMCTERAAIAQNLLSLFGIESYYCMGCVNYNNHQEAHCFNIAKAQDGYLLLDYSIPCLVNSQQLDYAPFQAKIENDIEDILSGNINMNFSDYEYAINDGRIQRVPTGSNRTYAVGKYSLELDEVPHM